MSDPAAASPPPTPAEPDDPTLGHRKAMVAPIVAAPVSVGSWWLSYKYAVEIPAHVVADILGFFTMLGVYFTKHSK